MTIVLKYKLFLIYILAGQILLRHYVKMFEKINCLSRLYEIYVVEF